MGHTIIRGETTDEKFASVDTALRQLVRRVDARKILAPLTPIVVVGYCKEDDEGVIARMMFPITGFITKISMFIERLEDTELLKKDVLRFCIEAVQPDGTKMSREFLTKVLFIEAFCNFAVAACSRIKVSVNTKVFGVWYGLVMEPEIPLQRQVEFLDIEVLSPTERAMIGE